MKRRKTAEHPSDMAGYVTFSSALNETFSLIRYQLDSFYYSYFILSFFIPHSTCRDKEIILREAKVLANLYCRMIHVSLFLFFPSLEEKNGGTIGVVFDFVVLL